ncbi:TetR/AcrR family transcriptional regulator [Streptomyces sp. GbtcB6]|uniref:TetR/AcrR family transcriptional regulator n=1 Tax=Streptomyces sp. GbtcB6 TaxID=2824751 RepID=UPI001C2F0F71|nr:TetR/AcrR family transcriptional regulator [Streptomyces sp. GbtcB6]
MPSTRSPRRRPDDARRTELLNAARTVIARDGVTAASTRRITEEAGLPHGMFHYWFSTKEELFEELIGEVVTELRTASASVTSKMDGDSDAGLVDRLRAAFEVVRHDEQRQPGRQIAMYELTTLALRTPALRDMARHQYAAYREATREATAPWLADHDVDLPGGSQALCELLAVVLDGAVLAWLADPEGSNPEQVFTVLDALLARAVPALRAEPAG